MVKAREKREKRTVTAARYVNEHTSGGSRAYEMPENVKRFTPKTGPYEIDIVPYKVGEASKKFKHNFAKPGEWHFERTIFVHYGIGPDNDSVVCLARTYDKPCPICEHRHEMALDPKNSEKAIKALASKERQLFLVLDHKEPNKGLQLWEIAHYNFGKQLQAKIQNASSKRRPQYEQFADPDEGSTLRIVGTEESQGADAKPFVKYNVDEFQEREEPIPEELLDHGIQLDEIVTPLTYDQLKKLFLQIDEDEDDKPARNGKPKAGKKAPKEEEEETEEEETEEEEVEEEEESEEEEGQELEVGMTVEWEYKGKTKTGTVTKINAAKELAMVEVEGQEKDSLVGFDEITIVEDEETEEEEEQEEEEVEEEEDEETETEEDDAWGEEEEVKEEEEKPKRTGKKPVGKKPALKKPVTKKPAPKK